MMLMKAKPIMSKKNNQIQVKSPVDKLELENQFIIRFPEDLASTVHESIAAGNINEKLTIQLDTEQRYGEVRLSDQLLHAKLVDLPTVIECYKTADNTNLYKTADISQLLVCNKDRPKDNEKGREKLSGTDSEDEPANGSEKELDKALQTLAEMQAAQSPQKKDGEQLGPSHTKHSDKEPTKQMPKKPGKQTKKLAGKPNDKDGFLDDDKENISPALEDNRDFLRVDDKYLWPHGLTPPCRNLRRRRLNNALKEKAVEPPEPDILREVKYLLRMDSEAVRVDYEVVNESGTSPADQSDDDGTDDSDVEMKGEIVQ